MKRAVAKFSPSLALAVAGLWLLLNETLAVGQVLLGAALGFALAGAASTLRPLQARIGRIDVAMVLFGVVLTDIVRSNLDVARLVLQSVQLASAALGVPADTARAARPARTRRTRRDHHRDTRHRLGGAFSVG